ncbi:hypothetical protein [Legionella londiniensis]
MMIYQKGDILLKVDTRAIFARGTIFDTRHHAMVVIDTQPQNKCPIVAHMTFHPPGLKIEAIKHGKDWHLVRYPFDDKVRQKIADMAVAAHEAQKLTISPAFLERQYNKSLSSRDPFSRCKQNKMAAFKAQIFNPTPPAITEISCHEFVLAIIHSALMEYDKPIPESLQFPPVLGWSDILLEAALHDKNAEVIHLPRIGSSLHMASNQHGFFSREQEGKASTRPDSACPIL